MLWRFSNYVTLIYRAWATCAFTENTSIKRIRHEICVTWIWTNWSQIRKLSLLLVKLIHLFPSFVSARGLYTSTETWFQLFEHFIKNLLALLMEPILARCTLCHLLFARIVITVDGNVKHLCCVFSWYFLIKKHVHIAFIKGFFHRCALTACLLNFKDDVSSWKQSAVAKYNGSTPQSVPFDCWAAGGMMTSVFSLPSTNKRAACYFVKFNIPL